MPSGQTKLNRIRLRKVDVDLFTTKLVGAGWTWECDCGERGGWESNRDAALEHARLHRLYKHGQQ